MRNENRHTIGDRGRSVRLFSDAQDSLSAFLKNRDLISSLCVYLGLTSGVQYGI